MHRGPEDKIRSQIKKRDERLLANQKSVNGWEMEKIADDQGHIYSRPVPGTPVKSIQVRMAEVETILVHVVRRFHYEIDRLADGEVLGWRQPKDVDKNLAESNQASGIAVQIRPQWYPAGMRGGFTAGQIIVIRDILADCEGTVRWGGDDRKVDEALFSIDVPPGSKRLAAVAKKLRGWADEPGMGAGSVPDTLLPARRKAAKNLEKRQRRS